MQRRVDRSYQGLARPRLPLLVAVVLVLSTAGVQAQAPVKIGVFDAQRISEETAEGQRVQARLNAFREQKQAELTAKEKQLVDLQGQLSSQALSLSAERRAALEKEIQSKVLDVNQLRERANREMQLEMADAQNEFQEKLFAVVQQFGRDEGFTMIVEVSLAAYAHESIDVTTALVDVFNKVFPGEGGEETAPAAAQED